MNEVGFEILPTDGCPTCQKLDEHRHQLQGIITGLEHKFMVTVVKQLQAEAKTAELEFEDYLRKLREANPQRINALEAGLSRLFDHAAEVRSYADGWEWKYKQSWDEEMEAARALLEGPL